MSLRMFHNVPRPKNNEITALFSHRLDQAPACGASLHHPSPALHWACRAALAAGVPSARYSCQSASRHGTTCSGALPGQAAGCRSRSLNGLEPVPRRLRLGPDCCLALSAARTKLRFWRQVDREPVLGGAACTPAAPEGRSSLLPFTAPEVTGYSGFLLSVAGVGGVGVGAGVGAGVGGQAYSRPLATHVQNCRRKEEGGHRPSGQPEAKICISGGRKSRSWSWSRSWSRSRSKNESNVE